MREYYLFLVKESIAAEFAGKEHKIHSLLLDSFQDELAKKQMEYITHRIPTVIDNIISNSLSENESYTFMNNIHHFSLEQGQAYLHISKSFVFLQSIGDNYTEVYFFEILRKWKKNFFAIEKNQDAYGWLAPIKKSEANNILNS